MTRHLRKPRKLDSLRYRFRDAISLDYTLTSSLETLARGLFVIGQMFNQVRRIDCLLIEAAARRWGRSDVESMLQHSPLIVLSVDGDASSS